MAHHWAQHSFTAAAAISRRNTDETLILEDSCETDEHQTSKTTAGETESNTIKKLSVTNGRSTVSADRQAKTSDRAPAELVTSEVIELCREVSLFTQLQLPQKSNSLMIFNCMNDCAQL